MAGARGTLNIIMGNMTLRWSKGKGKMSEEPQHQHFPPRKLRSSQSSDIDQTIILSLWLNCSQFSFTTLELLQFKYQPLTGISKN